MTKKKILLINLLPLLISSCGQNTNNVHILRNGDIYKKDITSFDDVLVETTYEEISSLIENEEGSLLLIHQNECHYCIEKQPYFVDLVKNTSSLIYSINIDKSLDEFDKLMKSEIFDALAFQGTPSFYVLGSNIAKRIPNSRIGGSIMLQNAMNDYVYYSNIYAFTNIEKYHEMLNDSLSEGLVTILMDRSNIELMRTYKTFIKEKIYNTNKAVALIDINKFDKETIKKEFNIDSLTLPTGIYSKNKTRITYEFSPTKDNSEFLSNYL
ncbi:MAG TPA: hypothetical protein DDW20_00470 [Firmicutes bacterium]|nr:hypothetical protein [Bacillota bacterium]